MTNKTIVSTDGKNSVDVSLSEKRLIEEYADFMGRKKSEIVDDYFIYKSGDGEIAVHGDDCLHISNWIRERISIDDMRICTVCDQIVEVVYKHGEESVCRRCEEDDLVEPMATVKHSEFDRPLRIGHYINETELELGDECFEAEWVSTSAWRGHVKVSANGGWSKVKSDYVLTAKNDADVKKLDDDLKDLADGFDVEWARVVSRTSNVFSTGWDFYVRGSDSEKFLEEVENRYD